MKKIPQMLKASLLLYGGLFALQLVFYFFAPSFYVSSPGHLKIPNFIIFTFIKYFGLVVSLYIVWAILLGIWNSLLLRINRPLQNNQKTTQTYFLLCLAQFLGTLIFLGYRFPSVLNNYPVLRQTPMVVNFLILLLLLITCSYYFLKTRTQALQRGIPQVVLSLLLPIGILSLLFQTVPLDLPTAPPGHGPGQQNILLIGFDALDGDTGNFYLKKRLEDKGGILFTNAFTPLPLTHPAWNSILTGLYPHKHGVRYFFDSPMESEHPELFLPRLLKNKKQYHTLFASDQPETSYFISEQEFDDTVIPIIGWKAHMVAMILNHFVFPAAWLNNAWVEKLSNKTFNFASLYNYDLNRFFNRSFQKLDSLGNGPKFLALHTCYLHTPIRLTHNELKTLPKFWTLAPQDFSFEKWPKPGKRQMDTPQEWINPYFIRRDSVVHYADTILRELEKKGYLEKSTVVVLSDHGERFIKEREIYGGVHGVDLETREQSNVVLALIDPKLKNFQEITKMVSLIDVTPTLLSRIGIQLGELAFDGIPLVNAQGQLKTIPKRPILAESMGYIDDTNEKVKFPQIAIQTLEESLSYGANGTVTIGMDYFTRILTKKEFADFSKKPALLVFPDNKGI